MPHRVTCPHCASALKVMDSVTASFVTCPRCLALIPNPGVSEERVSAAGTELVLALSADDEVRGSIRVSGIVLILLAAVGGLGMLFLIGLLINRQQETSKAEMLPIYLTIFVFSALISFGIMMPRMSPSDRRFRNFFLGTLAVVGAIVLGVIALLIMFLIVCSFGGF